jgi:hypothetical protein
LQPSSRTAFQQAGIQIDRAFWCIQDHPGKSLLLSLPALTALALVFVPALLVARHWDLPWYIWYLVYIVALPVTALMILTFCPIPAAVLAYELARGTSPSVSSCFGAVGNRLGGLVRLGASLLWRYVLWMAFFAVPALVYWPRSCLAPQVVLFENERRTLWRSRKLLSEEGGEIRCLFFLYLGLLLVFIILLFTPRILATAKLLDLEVLRILRDNLAVFEIAGVFLSLVILSTCWTLSVTFLYIEIRTVREGVELRNLLERVKEKHGGQSALPTGSMS